MTPVNTAPIALPDAVLGFGAMHLGLRAEARGIHDLVDQGRRDDAARRAAVLARVLGQHHHSEDDLLWPALTRRQPGFLPTSATLEGQHAQLDEEMHLLRAEPERIDVVLPILEDHLRLEEETVLPVWLASFSADEHERFGRLLRRSTSLGAAAVMVAWLLDVTPESLRGIALGRLPAPFRAAHRIWWRSRYERRYGAHVAADAPTATGGLLAAGLHAVTA
jgi:hypothetical protein